MSILGLDLGKRRIGIAIADTPVLGVRPLATLVRGSLPRDFDALRALAVDWQVRRIILGLPLNMNGSEGPSAQSARAFARNFAARSPLPILMWDERFSTAAVIRTLIDSDASRKRRAEVVDKMAAGYILQGVLDRLRNA